MVSPGDMSFSGFDAMPEITEAEAYQAEFDTVVGEIADDIDGILNHLDATANGELSAISDDSAELRATLFDAGDRPTQRLRDFAGELMVSLGDTADAEMSALLEDVQPTVRRAGVCGLIPPPGDVWRGNVDDACKPENADALHVYNGHVVEWLMVADPPLAVEARAFLATPQDFNAAKLFIACGRNVWIYKCGNTQPPGPPLILPPPGDVVGDCGPEPFATAVVGNPLTSVWNENIPAFPTTLGFIVPKLANIIAVADGRHITIQYNPSGQCRNFYVTAFCNNTVTPNKWEVMASPTSPGADPCDEFPKPKPEPKPEPEPEPVPEPEPGDWIDRLCECLSKDKGKPQNVWVNCDTCEVYVTDDTEEIRDAPWKHVVEIAENGEATYLEQCDTGDDGDGDDIEPPEKPKPPLIVPPHIEELARAICTLPKTLAVGEGVADEFIVGQRLSSFAFAVMAWIPSALTVHVRPDGALIGLSVLFLLMGQSVAISQDMAKKLGCDAKILRLIFTRQFFGLFERILPGGFGEHITRQTQEIRQLCPSMLPTLEQAHASYLADRIDENEWRCWVRANDRVDPEQAKVRESMRTRPGVSDLNTLRRRKIITQQQYEAAMRGIGVTVNAERDHMFALSEQVPTMQDIIRFMVRDTDDEVNIDWTESDATFVQKFQKQLRKWAEDQGIPEVVAKYAWRAHWVIPSPTQLFEMFHRLGRDANGDPDIRFLQRIKGALQQQDILPFWVDKFLDISYRLPTRVDVRRAYRIGVLSKQQVKEQYIKSGYDRVTSEALTEFTAIEADMSISKSPWVSQFAKGELTEDELRDKLKDEGAIITGIDRAVDRGRLLMKANRRKKCLAAIRRRVFLGEIDKPQAVALALQHVNDQQSADELATTWFCEREAASRELTLRQLLQLYKEMVITADDLFNRLVRLRYSANDASVIVARAVKDLQRTLEQAEMKRLQKATAEAKAKERETAKLERQRQAEQQRTERAREAAEKAERKREVQIMEAAKLIANRAKLPVVELNSKMLGAYRRIRHSGLVPADQAADAAVKVAGASEVLDYSTWELEWLDVIADMVAG